MDAPEKVVLPFVGRGDLERGHHAPDRVETAHDVADRAVLAAGVHGLDHHQQRIAVVGVEEELELAEALQILGEALQSLGLAP